LPNPLLPASSLSITPPPSTMPASSLELPPPNAAQPAPAITARITSSAARTLRIVMRGVSAHGCSCVRRLYCVNPPARKHILTFVQYHRLPRCDCPARLGE